MKKGDRSHPFTYFLGPGGLFPLPPPDGFPVVLGPLGGLCVDFAIGFNLNNCLLGCVSAIALLVLNGP